MQIKQPVRRVRQLEEAMENKSVCFIFFNINVPQKFNIAVLTDVSMLMDMFMFMFISSSDSKKQTLTGHASWSVFTLHISCD